MMLGDGFGQVDSRFGDDWSFTTCTASCSIDVEPGTSVHLFALTPFDFAGWGGLCSGSPTATCSFTMPESGEVTVQYNRHASDLWTRLLLPDETVLSVGFDPESNVVLGTTIGVFELTSTGADAWSYAAVPGVARVDDDGNVFIVSGEDLVKLGTDGSHQWTVPLGSQTGTCENGFAMGHSHETSPTGDVAVQWGTTLRVFTADGSERWSVPIATTENCRGVVAFDSAGDLHTAVEDPISVEPTRLLRFAGTDGTALGSTGIVAPQYTFAMDFEADDHLITSSTGFGNLHVQRSTPGGDTALYLDTVDLGEEAQFRKHGIAADSWGHAISIYVEREDGGNWGYVLRGFTGDGTVFFPLTRPHFQRRTDSSYGFSLHDLGAGPDGRIAVVGRYCDAKRMCTGIVQVLLVSP